MSLDKIFANLNCADLSRSTAWFTAIFARAPDAHPMPGLAEWHHRQNAGFQLFQNPQNAGRGTLTLIVDSVRQERARLNAAGLRPGTIENADDTTIVRLNDPDGNLVVLAQPGRA